MPPVLADDPAAKAGRRARWNQAAKDFSENIFATPDHHAGWIASCVRQGFVIIRDQRPDIILATGGPWSGLLAGYILKRLTGVPLALDFRDPWVAFSDPYRRGIFRWIDNWLERRVVSNADLLIANTEPLKQDFLRRYVNLSPEQVVTITNGFEDFIAESSRRENSALTLTHTGTLYLSRNPRPLLEAVQNLIEGGRIDPMEIKLRFVGGIELNDPSVAQILRSPSLASSIEVTPRVTYAESLQAMRESDMLILIQPGFPLQVPRKFYDYMAARRPVLCIAEPGSATWSLVERYALGRTCENDASQLEAILLEIHREWQSGRLESPAGDQFEPFRNLNLTMRLRHQLEQTIRMSTEVQ